MFSPDFFTSVINHYLPEPQASLLNGIIFGVNLKTSKSFYEQLKAVGLLHLVVLSGSNISLLAAMVSGLTVKLSKRLSSLITILIIIIFIIFVGPQAPVVRAGIMGVLTLVAIIYGRKNFVFYSLFISLIIIAIFWPKWLTSLSLQLSYGATIGIILFAPRKKLNYFKQQFLLSLSAQVFTAPLIFIHFRQLSLISPIANVLVAWLILPLMIFGFLTAGLGKINYWLGLIPSYICYGLLTYMVKVIDVLSKIPFGYFKF